MSTSILITPKGKNGEHSISKFYFSLFLTTWVETKSIQLAINKLSDYNNLVIKNMIKSCPLKLTSENSARLFIKSACAAMEENYNLKVVTGAQYEIYCDKYLKKITPKEPISDQMIKELETADEDDEFEIKNEQVKHVINYLGIYEKTVNNAFEDDQDTINHLCIESMFSNYVEIDNIVSIGVNLGDSKFSVRKLEGISIDSLLKEFKI